MKRRRSNRIANKKTEEPPFKKQRSNTITASEEEDKDYDNIIINSPSLFPLPCPNYISSNEDTLDNDFIIDSNNKKDNKQQPTSKIKTYNTNSKKNIHSPRFGKFVSIVFNKNKNQYEVNKNHQGNILDNDENDDNKNNFIIKYNRDYISKGNIKFICLRCDKSYGSSHDFQNHFQNHFTLRCFCGKECKSISLIKSCCSRNNCNKYDNLSINEENQIDILYQVPENYMDLMINKININNSRKNNDDYRWKINKDTIIFKGYESFEIKNHHNWINILSNLNIDRTNQDNDSIIIKKNTGKYRQNCYGRSSNVESFIGRYFKFIWHMYDKKLNEVSYKDFFNDKIFETFFKFYSDTHSESTTMNQMDYYKIVIKYLTSNFDVSKEFKYKSDSLHKRCSQIRSKLSNKLNSSSKYILTTKSTIGSSSGSANELLSTHLQELNEGKMLCEDEMFGLFNFLFYNFKNISLFINLINFDNININDNDNNDFHINIEFYKSLFLNFQIVTYHLFGIALYGQRSQIVKYSNINRFVMMEDIFGYIPSTEKILRKDKVIPLPNWLIPIFVIQKKIRNLLLYINSDYNNNNNNLNYNDFINKYNTPIIDDNNYIIDKYESVFINNFGKPFTEKNFNNMTHIFKFIYCNFSISFSRSYRRGLFTLYVSENFNRFYDLLGIDDSRMINLISKSFNTSEDIIKKYYIRSNSIKKTNKLTSTIRSELIGNENDYFFNNNFNVYELNDKLCENLNIKKIKYSDYPTTRNYILFDSKNKSFNVMFKDEIKKSLNINDILLIKLDNDGIPILNIPEIPNLFKIKRFKCFISIKEPLDKSLLSLNFKNIGLNDSLSSLSLSNRSILNPIQIINHKSDDDYHYRTISKENCKFLILWDDSTETWEDYFIFQTNIFKKLLSSYINLLFNSNKLIMKESSEV